MGHPGVTFHVQTQLRFRTESHSEDGAFPVVTFPPFAALSYSEAHVYIQFFTPSAPSDVPLFLVFLFEFTAFPG